MIRVATIDDLEQLAALYKELMIYHHKLDPEKYEIPDDIACEKKMRFFAEDTIFKTICHETDKIIDGFLVYILLASHSTKENPNGFVTVNNIVVAENARRKGIGTELMNEIKKMAKENFCDTIAIDVHIDNDIARKFYEKLGMIPTTIHMEKRI